MLCYLVGEKIALCHKSSDITKKILLSSPKAGDPNVHLPVVAWHAVINLLIKKTNQSINQSINHHMPGNNRKTYIISNHQHLSQLICPCHLFFSYLTAGQLRNKYQISQHWYQWHQSLAISDEVMTQQAIFLIWQKTDTSSVKAKFNYAPPTCSAKNLYASSKLRWKVVEPENGLRGSKLKFLANVEGLGKPCSSRSNSA